MTTHIKPETRSDRTRDERRRRLGLTLVCVWAFLLPIQLPGISEDQDLNLALSDFVLIAGLAVTFPILRLRPRVWSIWHLAMPMYLAFSAVVLGPLTRYSVANKVVGMVVLLASYLFVSSVVHTWDEVARVVRAFFAGMVILTILAIVRYTLGMDFSFTYCQTCDVRLLGFLSDANLYGSLLVVAIAAYLAMDGSRQELVHPALRWPSIVILVSALALTSSRSAWLALIAVVVLAYATGRRRGLPSLLGGIGVVVGLGFLIIPERILEFTELAGRTHSIDSRFALIDHGIDAFFENPLLGIGLGNSHERYGQIIHNTLLWVAAELGVIGLIVFGGFLVWVLARLTDAYLGAQRTYRPIVVFLIMGNAAMVVFSLSVEAFYQRHWWLLFSLAACASALVVRGEQTDAGVVEVADRAG